MKTLNDVIKTAGGAVRELSEEEMTVVSGGPTPFTDNQGDGCGSGSQDPFCQAFDESFAQG